MCVIGRIATRDPGIVQILRYFGFLFSSGFFAASARLERDYVHFLIGIWPISLCHKSGTTRVLPPYPSANAMCGTSFGSTCANGVLWNVVRHSVRFYLCASSKRVCVWERVCVGKSTRSGRQRADENLKIKFIHKVSCFASLFLRVWGDTRSQITSQHTNTARAHFYFTQCVNIQIWSFGLFWRWWIEMCPHRRPDALDLLDADVPLPVACIG